VAEVTVETDATEPPVATVEPETNAEDVAIAEAVAEAQVEMVEAEVAAAVEIAEIQAEVDEEWLKSQFDAVNAEVAAMRLEISAILSMTSSMQEALAILLTPTPSTEPQPEAAIVEEPPIAEPTGQSENTPEEKRRVRRLI
jgi:hypothetical protein